MDAETYLRCRLEDALLAGASGDELTQRVRAVMALGMIDDAVAERVLADLDAARQVRQPHEHWHHVDEDDDEAAGPRVVACPTAIARDWGTLVITHLVFGEHDTTVGVGGTLKEPPERFGHRRDEPWMQLEVIGPSGTKHEGEFAGGSSDVSFDGHFRLDPPIAADAGWIEIGGQRILLADPAPPLPFRVRSAADLSIAERAGRHLQLLHHEHHHFDAEDESDVARETFEQLGVQVVDEPVAVSPGARRRPQRPRQPDRTAAPRLVALGTTTPSVDGITLTLTTLSAAGELGYTGRSSGRYNGASPRAAVRITAHDDLGTDYLGEPADSGHDGSTFHGTVRMEPVLDPATTMLTIEIDTLRHRFEVDVPLDWQEPQ